MIREENDWRGKWVWDNWYFKWSQKTQRWEQGPSFPRVSWSLVPQLTKHKRYPSSLPSSLSLPTTAAIRRAERLMNFCNRWLLAGEWLSVPSFSVCFDCLRFFFPRKKDMQRTQPPKNKGFFELPAPLNQIALPFCEALPSFVILMMIIIIMSRASFLVLHAFQSTYTYIIPFDFPNNSKAGNVRTIIQLNRRHWGMKRLNYLSKVTCTWLINDKICTSTTTPRLGIQFTFY